MRIYSRPLMLVFLSLVTLWGVLAALVPTSGQRSLFFVNGRYPLWDHRNFRRMADVETPYRPQVPVRREDGAHILRQDICYPALVLLLLGLVPETPAGELAFVGLGLVAYLAAAHVFGLRYCPGSGWTYAGMLACVAPLVFSVQVGNTITFAAAAVLLFMAWHDAPSPGRRIAAACCLALAGVMKVTPVLLGLTYLGRGWRRNLGMIALSASLTLLLLALPFLAYGGADGLVAWVENAGMNAAAYAERNEFGVYGVVASVVRMLGYWHDVPVWLLSVARAGSVALALSCLVFSLAERDALRRLMLISLGMLFLPSTMMVYAGLYVLPVLLAAVSSPDAKLAKSAACAFFALGAPLRIPLLFGSANACFSSVALVDVALLLVGSRLGGLARKGGTDGKEDG